MSAVAALPAHMKRRLELRRQLTRQLVEIDGVLELLKERLESGSAASDRGRKVFHLLRECRRDLAAGMDELMHVPDEEWSWQRRDLGEARDRLLDLLDSAVVEHILKPAETPAGSGGTCQVPPAPCSPLAAPDGLRPSSSTRAAT